MRQRHRRLAGLPSFEPVARLRPVAIVQPGTDLPAAPYAAVERDLTGGPAEAALTSGASVLRATWDGRDVALVVSSEGRETRHASVRHGRAHDPTALALALTGPHVTAFVAEAGRWVARAAVDLDQLPHAPDVHDEAWLAGLAADGDRAGRFGQLGLRDVRAGRFGQLGLRDVRVVTEADGAAYRPSGAPSGEVLLCATSAGPAGFRTGHTSVWALDVADPARPGLEHRADLFFRRPDRPGVYGDHATHLLRDGDTWLAATSTWGDFARPGNEHVSVTLASSASDLTTGCHVLDTEPLALPVDGLGSVGTWDAHLVRTTDGWLAAYVSASRFFAFHPVVAHGPDLRRLRLRAAATDRTATEGPTLIRVDGAWRLLASDGRDGPRRHRAAYPAFDLDLRQVGVLDAAYPSNIPWPTLVTAPGSGDPVLVGFDGTTYGGRLPGYGTHGDVVVQRVAGSRR